MKKIKSPAKINLGLWILRKRPDQYHEIYTVMHTVDLFDIITINPYISLKVEFSNPNIPPENTVIKAVKAFENYTGIPQNYYIYIEKNIPIGSGLGGGSSNAASVLMALNELSGNILSIEELHKLAEHIGADVPFFLEGGMAIVQGIGEKIEKIEKTLDKDIFIIYPNIQSKTEEIYKRVTPDMLTSADHINIIDNLLKQNKFEDFIALQKNTLGDIAKSIYPVINEVLNTLEFLGYRGYITGSGSAVYVFGKPDEKVENVCKMRNWKLIKAHLI